MDFPKSSKNNDLVSSMRLDQEINDLRKQMEQITLPDDEKGA